MKARFLLFAAVLFLVAACGPKSAYQTRSGKKKNKKYNDILYDQKWKSNKRY